MVCQVFLWRIVALVTTEPTVQTAAFLLPPAESTALFTMDDAVERLRCASVLKPLVFWAAAGLPPYVGAPADWERLARDGVTVSANDSTVEVWQTCGGEPLLDALADRTGLRLPLESGGERAFGRVLITADDLARGYARLAASGDAAAGRVRRWMLDVPDRQTFGVRPLVARRLGVPASHVAVKSGWFCDSDEQRIRTHVVTMTETRAGIVGTAVLTALPADQALRRAYTATYRHGEEVLELHEQHAGSTVRAATEQAAGVAL
jgi:hypothetical protein